MTETSNGSIWRFLASGYNAGPEAPGIHRFEFDADAKTCELVDQVAGIASPSYCAPFAGRLYAASETPGRGGFGCFDMDASGVWKLRDQVHFDGAAGTCFVLPHPDGTRVYGADYNSGSVSCCTLDVEGALLEPATIYQHEGHGMARLQGDPDLDRQLTAHVHTLSIVPGTQLLAAVDLGLDMIVLYQTDEHGDIVDADEPIVVSEWPAALVACPRSYAVKETPDFVLDSKVGSRFEELGFDDATGHAQVRLTRWLEGYGEGCVGVLPARPAAIVEAPLCSGPRIVAYHPSKPIVAVICELSGEILLFDISDGGRRWEARERWSLVGDVYDNDSVGQPPRAAHVVFSSDGRFLYASVRGTDKMIVFSLDEDCRQTGRSECDCGGMTPRHFALSPDEKYLAVGNKDSGNVVVFACCADGTLEQLVEAPCPAPSCIVWE